MNAFDQQLRRSLKDTQERMRHLQSNLYFPNHGCACSELGLCGHHAVIFNMLDEATKKLELAILQINRGQ